MKKYIRIIMIVIITLLPLYGYADTNEESIIVSANPYDYDEMTGVWNSDNLQTSFAPGNGDYPTLSSFLNESGTKTYSVDLGNKAGFYKTIEDGNSFYAGVWLRLRDFNTGSNFNIYSVEDETSHHRAFLWYNADSNVIKIEYYNGDAICTSYELSVDYLNKWVYLGFARDVGTYETKCTIYVNGYAVASGKNSSVNTGEATLNIATAKNPAYYGSESLGEVEVLAQIPNDDEILKRYTDNKNKYKAAEQNCKIFSLDKTDEKINAYIGTHTYKYGITESALILSEEEYIKVESDNLISGNEMTWELWISADTKKTGKIFAMGDIDNPEAHAFLQDGKVIFRAGRYDEDTYVSSMVCEIESKKLYHLVFTRIYFESEGKGWFKYSAYCNSQRINGFPFMRYGMKPDGQKTPLYIGGGISADILSFNIYGEAISPDNIRKMYLKTVRPSDVSPNFGEKNVNINSGNIELKYDLPVTEELIEFQNITALKDGQLLETVNSRQGNKLILGVVDGLKLGSLYSVYSEDKKLTEFETASDTTYVRYIYDFNDKENDPKIAWYNEPMASKVEFEINPKTNSRAMKFTGSNEDRASFFIDLPAAITTRYALVKMKATPTLKDDMIHIPNGPALLSEDEKTSAALAYYSNYPRIIHKNESGNTERTSVNSEVKDSTIAQGRTESYEALLDFKEKTVTFTDDHSNEVIGYFIDNDANEIKTLKFETAEKTNQVIYYDDIEIIGYNDPIVLEPVSYTVTEITCGTEKITSLLEAAGKTIDISIEKTGIVTLIGAIYDGNTLVGVAVCNDGVITLDIPKDAKTKAYTTKLFAWSSLTDIVPVLEAKPFF